ncbi:MAG: ribosome small subunit-dependent GTPase A [Bacteroidetes bacterium]|nr:ribosome small subunit-dependent GTPase A [Bacteroidota bacterium]
MKSKIHIISDSEKLQKHIAIRKSRSNELVLISNKNSVSRGAIRGKVVSIVGKYVMVEAKINGALEDVRCVQTGTIISKSKHSNLIAAGDEVYFDYSNSGLSKVVKVCDRVSKFSRISPSNRHKEQVIAANLDTLIIFASVFEPMLNTRLIDRYLVAARLNKIVPLICINKIDLCSVAELSGLMSVYKKLGIEVHFISSLYGGAELDKLKAKIINKKSVISGNSGSGKSTFMNALLGYKAQIVKEISDRTNKGIHTTSFSRLYKLSRKGWIIDTPGLREFGIWDLDKEEIGVIFPDFNDYYLHCKYTSCTHTHEPSCAVINAVEDGTIDAERYNSYLNIYESLEK